MHKTIDKILAELMVRDRLNQVQLSELSGVGQSTISRILKPNGPKGIKEPTDKQVRPLADFFRVTTDQLRGFAPIDSLLLASESSRSEDPAEPSSKTFSSVDLVSQMLAKHGKNLPDDARQRIADAVAETAEVAGSNLIQRDFSGLKARPNEIVIRQYDIRASMGHGQVPADYTEVVRNLIIHEDVLREKGVSYTSKSSLAMVTGWGQSMEGTINDKDPLIVDKGVNEFAGDGIYVLTWHEHLYIKRIQMLDAERFWLISDNEKHKDQEARIEDVTIHAKVLLIWNARKA